jgi:methylglyoxal synthase
MNKAKNRSLIKRIAIVADENKRTELIEWSYFNKKTLSAHEIITTDMNADLLNATLDRPVTSLAGGAELAKRIQGNDIDILVFFGDPGKAATIFETRELPAIALEKNIPLACNRSTADMIITNLRRTETVNTVTPRMKKFSFSEFHKKMHKGHYMAGSYAGFSC